MSDCLRAGKSPQFVTSHSGQLSLLPSAEQKMSAGQSAVTLCGWGVKTGVVHSTCGQTCDPSLTRAIPERFRDEFLMIKRYTNLRLLYFTLQTFKCLANFATVSDETRSIDVKSVQVIILKSV